MKRLALLACLWALPLAAQFPNNLSLDDYGGVKGLYRAGEVGPAMHLDKQGNRWLYWTPQGHPDFVRIVSNTRLGVGQMGKDHNWNIYDTNVATKYASAVDPNDACTTSTYRWGYYERARVQYTGMNATWGYDPVNPSGSSIPWASADVAARMCKTTGPGLPYNRMPYGWEQDTAYYAQDVRQLAPTKLSKQIYSSDNATKYVAGYSFGKVTFIDSFDPSFASYVNATEAALGAQIGVSTPGATPDPYLLFVGFGQIDYLRCVETSHPHCGFAVAALAPYVSHDDDGEVGVSNYADTKAYAKWALQSFLQNRYGSDSGGLAALCSAWGWAGSWSFQWRGAWQASTSYALHDLVANGTSLYLVTTAFTSGVSFTTANMTAWVPPCPTQWGATGTQITGETMWTADGSSSSFTYTLAHGSISPQTIAITADGVIAGGDSGDGTASGTYAAKSISKPSGVTATASSTGGSIGAGTRYYILVGQVGADITGTTVNAPGTFTAWSSEVSVAIASGTANSVTVGCNRTALSTYVDTVEVYEGASSGAEQHIGTIFNPGSSCSFVDTGAVTPSGRPPVSLVGQLRDSTGNIVSGSSHVDYAGGSITVNLNQVPVAGTVFKANYIYNGFLAGGTGFLETDIRWYGSNATKSSCGTYGCGPDSGGQYYAGATLTNYLKQGLNATQYQDLTDFAVTLLRNYAKTIYTALSPLGYVVASADYSYPYSYVIDGMLDTNGSPLINLWWLGYQAFDPSASTAASKPMYAGYLRESDYLYHHTKIPELRRIYDQGMSDSSVRIGDSSCVGPDAGHKGCGIISNDGFNVGSVQTPGSVDPIRQATNADDPTLGAGYQDGNGLQYCLKNNFTDATRELVIECATCNFWWSSDFVGPYANNSLLKFSTVPFYSGGAHQWYYFNYFPDSTHVSVCPYSYYTDPATTLFSGSTALVRGTSFFRTTAIGWNDPLQTFSEPQTQPQRATAYLNAMLDCVNAQVDGDYYCAAVEFWNALDNAWGHEVLASEIENFGIFTVSDNLYNGQDATAASGADINGFPRVAETSDYGDFTTGARAANGYINGLLLGNGPSRSGNSKQTGAGKTN